MTDAKIGPELDSSKWEYYNSTIDPNWRWMRWLYYDAPLSGLCYYDGKPAFYMIHDILTDEELQEALDFLKNFKVN